MLYSINDSFMHGYFIGLDSWCNEYWVTYVVKKGIIAKCLQFVAAAVNMELR